VTTTPATGRRRHPRLGVMLPIRWRTSVAAEFRSAVSKAISVGGLWMRTDVAPEPGERLDLRISLGDEQHPLQAYAEVRWTRGEPPAMDVGVEFTEIADHDREVIDLMVREVG
jgi:hypothetical protein